mmetsp:Transcript_7350/g.19784  ORF Transcript_7350/g.19784 Transcript_7350/m.19784 type:complete len:419 (+) Transcript_7350:404-1660(+)
MQRVLRVAVCRVEQAHLATEAIRGIPAVQVGDNAQLLGEVLHHELERDDPTQELPAFHIEVKAVQHQEAQRELNQQEECRCLLGSGEDPVVLSAVPLIEVLPAAFEAAVLLIVDLLEVLDARVHDVDVDGGCLGYARGQGDRACPGRPTVLMACEDGVARPEPSHGRHGAGCQDAVWAAASRRHAHPPPQILVRRQRLHPEQEGRGLRPRLKVEPLVGRDDEVEVRLRPGRREREDVREAHIPQMPQADAVLAVLRAAEIRERHLEVREVARYLAEELGLEDEANRLDHEPGQHQWGLQPPGSEVLAAESDEVARVRFLRRLEPPSRVLEPLGRVLYKVARSAVRAFAGHCSAKLTPLLGCCCPGGGGGGRHASDRGWASEASLRQHRTGAGPPSHGATAAAAAPCRLAAAVVWGVPA